MTSTTGTSLLQHFSALEDPRQSWKVLYPLPEVLLLVLCAALAGGACPAAREAGPEGRLCRDRGVGPRANRLLARFLPFRHIPTHDTLGDVMAALDPDLFGSCFVSWVEALREPAPDVVAIDGKTSRRTHARARGREPLHLVSAWASRQRLVLGQEAVAGTSNEITAIPLLLARLELEGALVTIDAMGCQTGIARAIGAKKADYLLAIKSNWPSLHAEIALLRRHAGNGARHPRDHLRRPRPDRDPPPCDLTRCCLARRLSPFPGRAASPDPAAAPAVTIAPFTASNAAGRGMAERLGGAMVREASATPGLWMATASAGSGGRRLEGWVDGNGTRVQVRLLDAAGGDPLWTAGYDDADDGAGTLAARIVADLLAATSLHAELYEPPCTRSCTR